MGIKQQIVVRNQFTVKQPGGRGSRGATPGAYVTRYMARDDAVETLAPIKRMSTDAFILRYMAREEAVERASHEDRDVPPSLRRRRAKKEMKRSQGEGGVAFGYGSVSLSDDQLKAASKDIQRLFDEGKTVLKTVVSFDLDYLKQHGIVDPDFELTKRGDLRGHVDQMKMRMAAMHGLKRMSGSGSGFDDLRYVGVFQVDTKNLHLHLAMVDAGRGTLAKDGTQRGKLNSQHFSRLRRGMDSWLDEKQAVAHLSSAVGYERRNVTSYIKRWAHESIKNESLPQFLLACLPQERKLWRASSNDPRMRKANRLVTELVTERLERKDSPWPQALQKIKDYANHRRRQEGLGRKEWQKLMERGQQQAVQRCVNGVYDLLRSLPEQELTVRTPMLTAMSMDYEQMALMAAGAADGQKEQDRQGAAERKEKPQDDLVSFGFRLRSYASRLRHHKKESKGYRDLAKVWEDADRADVASERSRPLYDFYRFEEDYHRRLVSKYQHFLPFAAEQKQWWDRREEVADYGSKLMSLTSMRHDSSMQRMKDARSAELMGREVYGQPGGGLLTQGDKGREQLDARIAAMQRGYDERVADLRADLVGSGLVLTTVEDGQGRTKPQEEIGLVEGAVHPFDDVKALDLHHLGYDFGSDTPVGRASAQRFVRTAERRRQLVLGAMEYLEKTGQASAIEGLPVDDIGQMMATARVLHAQMTQEPGGKALLPSKIFELQQERARKEKLSLARSKTTALDRELSTRLVQEVDEQVADVVEAIDNDLRRDRAVREPGA